MTKKMHIGPVAGFDAESEGDAVVVEESGVGHCRVPARPIDVPTLHAHLAFLDDEVLPSYPAGRRFRVWVADCGDGEAAWGVAMLMQYRLGEQDWEVMATDDEMAAVERAKLSSYPCDRRYVFPESYRSEFCRFISCSSDRGGLLVIDWRLTKRVCFMHLPLSDQLPPLVQFDAIVLAGQIRCRLNEALSALQFGGYLLAGPGFSTDSPELSRCGPFAWRKQ